MKKLRALTALLFARHFYLITENSVTDHIVAQGKICTRIYSGLLKDVDEMMGDIDIPEDEELKEMFTTMN